MPRAEGKRIIVEGGGQFRLRDGLPGLYEDVPRIGEVLVQLGLPPEKLHKVLAKMAERQYRQLAVATHLAA